MPLPLSPKLRVANSACSGVVCCVQDCNNRNGRDKLRGVKRSYYSIPTEAKLRKLWVKAINRDGWTPRKWDKICSDHFTDGFRTSVEGTAGFVPSIFPSSKPDTTLPRDTKTSVKAGKVPYLNYTFNAPVKTKTVSVQRTPKEPAPGKAVWDSDSHHDYVKTKKDNDIDDEKSRIIAELKNRIETLECEKKLLEKRVLSISMLSSADECRFWTNLPNKGVFDALAKFLMDRSGGDLHYWAGRKRAHYSSKKKTKPGYSRSALSFDEELFMTLVKLKTGKLTKDVAFSFGVSESYVSRVFTTWVNFLATELKHLFEMKYDTENVEDLPECYQDMPSLLIVLDCTELLLERSRTLQARKETWSNYKNHDTVKFLIGMSPNMTTNFVSEAYGGRATDNFITLNSDNFMESVKENPGHIVMADRGFTLSKELEALNVKLVIPHFKGRDRCQMTKLETEQSASIAEMRIHVERLIQRIRTFHIWDSRVKLSQKDIINQSFIACAYLVNFQFRIKK